MVSITIVIFIIIGLVLLKLGKFFLMHALWSQVFGLCDLGAQNAMPKNWLMRVKKAMPC